MYTRHPVYLEIEVGQNSHVRYYATKKDVPYRTTKKAVVMKFYDSYHKKQMQVPNITLMTDLYSHLIFGKGPDIRYKDGNPHNTHITNLERVEYPKLTNDKWGVTNAIAHQTRDMSISGYTIQEIADHFNLHPTQIQRILTGKAHKSSFRYRVLDEQYEKERMYRRQVKAGHNVHSEDATIHIGYYAAKIITERIKKEIEEEKQNLINKFKNR